MAKSQTKEQVLLERISDLQRELSEMRVLLDLRLSTGNGGEAFHQILAKLDQLALHQPRFNQEPQRAVNRLAVFFDRTDSERKPYLVKADGVIAVSLKLSPIRAAVLLVLLLDLQDRTEGGRGVVDKPQAMVRSYARLDPSASEDKDYSDQVRVAVYRFEEFFQAEKGFVTSEFRLWYDAKNVRLELFDQRTKKLADSAQVSVTTNNPLIVAVLDQTLHQSPITRARKRKALYIPAGPEGADRFLLEMYDHNFPLKVTSLYVRPPFQSYPTSLLEYIGVSERTIVRKRLAFEGYKSGRFRFLEILPEQTIWDLIAFDPERGFKFYPKNVQTEHVLSHLDNLVFVLSNFDNYHLYLTRVPIPFVLVTYEIRSGVLPEYFVVFFQAFSSAAERDLGCFVLHDPLAHQSISENVIDWIVSHPTTIRDRAEVIALLREVRARLVNEGPIPLAGVASH